MKKPKIKNRKKGKALERKVVKQLEEPEEEFDREAGRAYRETGTYEEFCNDR